MLTLTTLQMRDAFAEKIRDIVPVFEPLRAVRWSYTPSPRVRGRAHLELGTRNFDLLFGPGAPSYEWGGGIGTAYQLRLGVATCYTGIEPELLEHAITQDGVDLRSALNQLRDPTLGGLVNVEPLGVQNAYDDGEANLYLEHAFTISYHQATTTI